MLPVCAFALLLAGKVLAVDIAYAPEVVFSGEPLAFRLQSSASATVTVSTNGLETARLSLAEGRPSEHTFRPSGEMRLSFSSGDTERIFQIVGPLATQKITERDGYLEADGVPAILLPEHRKPPPLDRRWETLDLVRRSVRDPRQALPSILWISPEGRGPDLGLAGKLSAGAPVLLPISARQSWFYVHGLLTEAHLPSTRFVVLEVDEQDLEKGMPPHEWFMKWQFALQKLKAMTGYETGLLLGPPASPLSAPWLPRLREELQTLARAHNLHYIDRSLPEALWSERLLNRLSREYLLP